MFKPQIINYSRLIEYILQTRILHKQKMAEHRKRHWKDVVEEVERAGIDEQYRIKAEEREINRTYTDIIEQEIVRSREENKKRSLDKVRERKVIEEQVRQQKEQKIIEKRQKMKKQLESKEINYDLIQQIRASKRSPQSVPEHSFIKLVDGQLARKQQTKKKMRLQNDINVLQSKIKEEQKKSILSSQKQERDLYINYVDRFYEKKIQNRNIFKQKYLKLNNLERSRLILSRNDGTEDVEKNYNSYLSNQIEEKKLQKQKKDELDDRLEKINKHADVLSSSPAFLGRNPMNYDRRKQLEYLKRGTLHKKQHIFPSQFKIEPQIPSTKKKEFSVAQQVPILQKYYTNSLKNEVQLSNSFNSPSVKTIEKEVKTVSQKSYKIKELEPLKVRTRMNTEPAEPNRERKKFMTFDIILGQSKAVYI